MRDDLMTCRLTVLCVFAALMATPVAFAGPAATVQYAAASTSFGANEYGYGRQAQPTSAPIDLRRAVTPVRAPAALRPVAPTAEPAMPPPAPAPLVVSAQPAIKAAPPASRPDWLAAERTGAPYEANGVWYAPTPEPGFAETGRAVVIESRVDGKVTASGEPYAPTLVTGAHPTLPLPSLVQVTDLDTGREIIVRLTDRGPFVSDALVALSPAALAAIGRTAQDTPRVHVRYLGPAPKRVDRAGVDTPSVAVAAVARPSTPSVPAAVTAPVARTAPGDGFLVQIGAFGALPNAEKARRAVASTGPVSVDAVGGLHRVRIGPLASREAAEQVRATVAGLGFPAAVITRLR